MKIAPEIERIIRAFLLRLRVKSPFFATLALFTDFHPSEEIPTAATDGKNIFFNPEFVSSLSSPKLDGLLLHEVLHAALLHVIRRRQREPKLWNIAADIVVNGMIAKQTGFELTDGGIRDIKLEHFSVEEIYEILLSKTISYYLEQPDLLDEAPGDISPQEVDSLAQTKQTALETHWKNAMQQAMVVVKSSEQGNIPAYMQRELGGLKQAQLNWRSYLWRYLVRTPTDFTGFDRRFIGRKLYLEALEGESVQVFVAVDTSGSINNDQMQLFLSEVKGIINAYPHLECEIYYADTEVYGPYSLTADSNIPTPVGGGGTSFIPFFEKVSASTNWYSNGVCVYLTDGYGEFPSQSPHLPVLWVVTPGGLELGNFPFGEAVRLLQ